MPNYRRANQAGGSYFFTVVSYRRQHIFCEPAFREALRVAVEQTRTRYPFEIDAWVLLPDHLHCIWTLSPDDADFATRWAQIKRQVSLVCGEQFRRDEWLTSSKRKHRKLWGLSVMHFCMITRPGAVIVCYICLMERPDPEVQYAYDTLGRLTQLTSPDAGTKTLTYNTTGLLASLTDARGKAASYTYDNLNRVAGINFGDQQVSVQYDTSTGSLSRIAQITDSAGITQWRYDSRGRIVSKKYNQTYTLGLQNQYAYNAAGQLASVTYPSGTVVSYNYVNNLLNGISVNGKPLLSQINFTPNVGITSWNWANGQMHSRVADLDLRTTYLQDGDNAKAYGFDAASRITQIADQNGVGLIQNFTYDTWNELTQYQTPSLTENFQYDQVGNRTQQILGSATTNLSYAANSNALTRQSGAINKSYSYDSAGYAIADGTFSYVYDNAGRLTSVKQGGSTVANYKVNVLGQRMGKSVGNVVTRFMYDEADHLVGEYDGTGKLIEETVWLGNTPVAVVKPNASGGREIYYVHADHLNAPREIVDQTGKKVWTWFAEPFAVTTPNSDPGNSGNPFAYNLRLPGQYYDKETNLHYNHFRYYDPSTGRYLSSDPMGVAAGYNTYGYVGGNPVNFIDPSGLLLAGTVGPAMGIPLGDAAGIGAVGNATMTMGVASGAGVAATAAGVRVVAPVVKNVVDDITIDGPNKTRVCQIRYKKKPVARIDYGPIKGSHGEPRLHGHTPQIDPNLHIPLDPRSFFD